MNIIYPTVIPRTHFPCPTMDAHPAAKLATQVLKHLTYVHWTMSTFPLPHLPLLMPCASVLSYLMYEINKCPIC